VDGLSLIQITYTHSPEGGSYATIHTDKSRHLANVYE